MRIGNWSVLVRVLSIVGVLTLSATRPAMGADNKTASSNSYDPVTDQRLLHPAAGDWLMFRRTYDGQGYSPLDQINVKNVKDLTPVWAFSTGVTAGHEAAPVVNNGVMFVTAAYNKLFAIDAKTGQLLWKYAREVPDKALEEICCDVVNRGVALYGDKVYMGTHDAHLVALDARTGKVVWDQKVADYQNGYVITSAPLIVKGKVVTGVAGGEYGIRGFIEAFDAETGKSVWKTYSIPGPGDPGHESWPAGDAWKNGGGSTWLTGTYDPQQNLIFWGVGNPGPWAGDVRPGDDLYTDSTLALDADTGQIRMHYQYTPHDLWDYDGVNEAVLVDVDHQGHKVHGWINANRNGYFYLLDRTNAHFIYGQPFASPTTFTGLDPKTGRPNVDPAKSPEDKKTDTCPAFLGGKNWMPISYSPATGYAYVPTNHWCMTISDLPGQYEAGKMFVRADFSMHPANPDFIGEFQAIDVATGKKVWSKKYTDPLWSGALSTAGSLVFTGTLTDRDFTAFNAKTGDVVWKFRTNSGIVGVPVTYTVDGVQYVAVLSGFGGAIPLWAGPIHEKITKEIPQGGVVWVFALKK